MPTHITGLLSQAENTSVFTQSLMLILLFVGFIGFLIGFIVIISIICGNFDMSYYKFVVFHFAVNLLTWWNTWFAYRLKVHPNGVHILREIELFIPGTLTATRAFLGPFLHLQFWSLFGLNLHSLALIYFTRHYPKYSGHYFCLYIVLILAISVIPSVIIHFWSGVSVQVEVSGADLNEIINYEAVHYFIVVSFVSTVFYLFLVVSTAKHMKSVLTRNAANVRSAAHLKNLKPYKLMIIQIVLYSFIVVWSLVCWIFNDNPFVIKHRLEVLMIASDITTVLPSLAFPFIDKHMRESFKKRFGKKVHVVAASDFTRRKRTSTIPTID